MFVQLTYLLRTRCTREAGRNMMPLLWDMNSNNHMCVRVMPVCVQFQNTAESSYYSVIHHFVYVAYVRKNFC